jgi:hypothetical protein
MSTSFTTSETNTFTVTHARHMAAKVSADLMRVKRMYGGLTDQEIDDYEEEVVALLKAGYLKEVTYGFKRGGTWIEPTLRYTAEELLLGADDDDPGRIRPRKDVSGAYFHSYLKYSAAWDKLTQAEKETFKGRLPFQRKGTEEPSVDGYFSSDKVYAAGGRALNRSSVRSW